MRRMGMGVLGQVSGRKSISNSGQHATGSTVRQDCIVQAWRGLCGLRAEVTKRARAEW
jgi:hypothetical protein